MVEHKYLLEEQLQAFQLASQRKQMCLGALVQGQTQKLRLEQEPKWDQVQTLELEQTLDLGLEPKWELAQVLAQTGFLFLFLKLALQHGHEHGHGLHLGRQGPGQTMLRGVKITKKSMIKNVVIQK